MKFIVFLGAFLWHLMPVGAQVKGMVKDNQGEPVVAANVFWINTTNGTVTDENGAFTIEQPVGAKKLVVSFIGYENDTIVVENDPPKIDYTGVNMIHFTQEDDGKSRYGLLKGVK